MIKIVKSINSKPLVILILLIICSIYGFGQTRRKVVDIRDLLLQSSKTSDKDFPDGKDVLLRHFSYAGKLKTKVGIIYVVNMGILLNHMSAPRAFNYIGFYNNKYKFLGKISYTESMPLWCEAGKVYLFGDLDGLEESQGRGNVIDLSDGFNRLKIYHEKKYGSSGGTLDN
jgi:hypothetical protein